MRVHRHGGTIFLLSVILLSPMHCTLNPEARAECRGVLRAEMNTSLAAKAALAHRLQRRTACNAAPPATPYRLPVGPKMADGVLKGVYP